MNFNRLKRRAYDRFLWWIATAVPFEPRPMPDFLIIGSSRSGTSWLHRILRRHPDVFCPRVKEVHFFDRGSIRPRGVFKFDPDKEVQWRWYALNFLRGRGKLIGDITPAYACLEQKQIRAVAQRLPEVKIIYCFRNPVQRAWSGVRKSFRDNGLGVHGLNGLTDQELIERATSPNQYAASAYADNIERWESCFPVNQIHYSFYDDLQEDPYRFLRSICEFLNISIDPVSQYVSRRPVNTAPDYEIPPLVWEELIKRYRRHIEYLEHRFERDLSHWVAIPENKGRYGSMR